MQRIQQKNFQALGQTQNVKATRHLKKKKTTTFCKHQLLSY